MNEEEAQAYKDFAKERDEIWEWLQVGIDKGWISEPFCFTHDGDPYMTAEEELEWEEGGDPCAPVVKLLGA